MITNIVPEADGIRAHVVLTSGVSHSKKFKATTKLSEVIAWEEEEEVNWKKREEEVKATAEQMKEEMKAMKIRELESQLSTLR
jgi:hypothetical protein